MAGQVTALDSWKDYVAVGSEVVQLIQLNSEKQLDSPKRIVYTKKGDLMQVQHGYAQCTLSCIQ